MNTDPITAAERIVRKEWLAICRAFNEGERASPAVERDALLVARLMRTGAARPGSLPL